MTDPMTLERLAEIETRLTSGRIVNVVTQRALLAEVRRLQDAVERVRELHRRRRYWHLSHSRPEGIPEFVCAHCADGDGAVEWPCPTIAALDGDEQ